MGMNEKTYVCVMFPYPSNTSLTVGHYYNYAIVDSYCRWLKLNGQEVFQPFGYDAFGLPAENYAKKIGGDPKNVTMLNISRFRQQMLHMNTQYEERLITCSPTYVKWTQWLFKNLYEQKLAYKAYGDVNYCTKCETVLANEQVKAGFCERCDGKVEIKHLQQWYFNIFKYRDRLLQNLDYIDYPESTKKQQKIWLSNLRDWCVSRQRKWGCPIPIPGETDTLDTFVDSSFYYLRYLTNSKTQFLPKKDYKQVDLYVGGSEHACMHLIYARFIHMFLFDIGIVPVEEPFKRVVHQGMITKDGVKISKSSSNNVDPTSYDSDELRMYLMFIGPYTEGGDWNDNNIIGIRRFINKMKTWLRKDGENSIDLTMLESNINSNVLAFKFNKVISDFMTFYNNNKDKDLSTNTKNRIITLLKVFAPGFNLEDKNGK